MLVTGDTQTHTQSQQSLPVTTAIYTTSFASHGNLVKQVGEGLLLLHFVGEDAEAQTQEVDSLENPWKLGAPKTPIWALYLLCFLLRDIQYSALV